MMKYLELTLEERQEIIVGEAITLTAVMAIVAVAIFAVIIYRLFLAKKGTANIGGWKFTWN